MRQAKALPSNRPRPGFLVWLRNNFFYGVAVVLPFAITFWLIWSVVSFIDDGVIPLLPPSMRPAAEAFPGAGLAIALVSLTALGALTANLVGRYVVRTSERVVNQVPLVRTIYGGAKQVLGNLSAPKRQSFQQAVLFEFPQPGVWTIGFITNENTQEISAIAGEDLVAVYVPQVPVPTTGFLQYLARSKLRPLPFGPEDALKMCISLGILGEGQGPAPVQSGPSFPNS